MQSVTTWDFCTVHCNKTINVFFYSGNMTSHILSSLGLLPIYLCRRWRSRRGKRGRDGERGRGLSLALRKCNRGWQKKNPNQGPRNCASCPGNKKASLWCQVHFWVSHFLSPHHVSTAVSVKQSCPTFTNRRGPVFVNVKPWVLQQYKMHTNKVQEFRYSLTKHHLSVEHKHKTFISAWTWTLWGKHTPPHPHPPPFSSTSSPTVWFNPL